MSAAVFESQAITVPTREGSRAQKRTLTMEESCIELGIPYSTGCMLANDGRFPCRVLKIGNRFYVPREALDELLSGRAA